MPVSVTKKISVTAQEFINQKPTPVSVTKKKQVSVTSVPKSEVLDQGGATFTPSWKLKGLASKPEAWKHVIKCLMENRARINRVGHGEPAVLYLGNYKITLLK